MIKNILKINFLEWTKIITRNCGDPRACRKQNPKSLLLVNPNFFGKENASLERPENWKDGS
jgi:hypothetical protein